LRAISDGPHAPIPFDLEAMIDEQYNLRTGKILRTILGHPQMLPQLMRMSRNTNLAADHAAIALIAALSQPGDLILQG
jgi:adenosylhomocysteine nucleosidase